MSSIAERVVIVSAAPLPTRVRTRYREQWLGELRDAPALGMRSSEIAMGSLAFAATFARPMPAGGRLSPEAISRRARLSVALSMSAVALAFSQYASAPMNAQTGSDPFAAEVGAAWTLLTLYAVVAPLTATFIVLATRRMRWRVRGAVVLLAALCAVPLAHSTIVDWILIPIPGRIYLALGTIAMPAVGFLVVLVAMTARRRRQQLDAVVPSERTGVRMRYGALAGLVLAVTVGAGFVGASALWASRTPLYFRGPITKSNRADFEQWLALKASAEHMVTVTLDVWLATGLIVACGVALSGLSRRSTLRRTVTLCIGAMSLVVLSFGSLVSFLQMMLPSIAPSFPIDLATEVGQIVLVVLVLVTAGGRRNIDSVAPAPEVGIGLVATTHG